MTFVSYLMHIRMEEAKSLLRTTDLKAFEIADKVGYTDPNYFSFSFRKQVGISPKEYRNNDKED
jgi:two-component system response regulator YesN